jgi:hypothetical protein
VGSIGAHIRTNVSATRYGLRELSSRRQGAGFAPGRHRSRRTQINVRATRAGATHPTGDVAQGSLSSPAVLPVRISFQAGRGKSRLPNVRRRKGPRRLKSRRAEPQALRYICSPVPRLREQRPLARPPLVPADPVPAKAGRGNQRQGISIRRAHTRRCMRRPRAGAPHPTGNVAQGSLFSPAVLPPRWGFDDATEVVRVSFQADPEKSRLPNVRRWKGRRACPEPVEGAEPRAPRYIRPTARDSREACPREGGERESATRTCALMDASPGAHLDWPA